MKRVSPVATYMVLMTSWVTVILKSCRGGLGGLSTGLWIYRWDGVSGIRINALDDRGFTTMNEYGGLEFADVEGDGIWEIQGVSSAGESPEGRALWNVVTYSWNGELYNNWSGAAQPGANVFLPRNRIDVDVKAALTQAMDLYQYRYKISNQPSSKQRINDILIGTRTSDIQEFSARNGWESFNHDVEVEWVRFGPSGEGYPVVNYISPNETDSSFIFKSSSLPCIVKYYIQAYNNTPLDTISSAEFQNQLTNSATGLTISAADLPSPFDGINFLDTVKSYITQSHRSGG